VPPDVPPPSSQDRSKNPFVQQRDEVAWEQFDADY
jgi:hypothetical protein